MKKKNSEKLTIIKKTTVQFPDLGILGKQVVWAKSARELKYFVWVEDEVEEGEDVPTESIKQVPLQDIMKYSPNVCKNKQTAESIFEYYLDGLTSVTEDTLQYFQSKGPIPTA